MAFSKMIELLQKKDEGKIILVNAGAFYIARGKDAELNTQRIYLRIMKNNKWIDERKFRIVNMQSRISNKLTRKIYKINRRKRLFIHNIQL